MPVFWVYGRISFVIVNKIHLKFSQGAETNEAQEGHKKKAHDIIINTVTTEKLNTDQNQLQHLKWFYLNLNALYKMQFIYDEYINIITSKDSEYKRLLTQGWPLSEYFDLNDTNDSRQFSNIIINNKKNYKLMKYQDWEMPNIHAFLKYYFLLKGTKFELKFISRFQSILSMFLFANYKRIFILGFKELFFGFGSKFIYYLGKIQLPYFLK